jgi:hypothetical protein
MKLKTIGYRNTNGTIVKTFALNNLTVYRRLNKQWQTMNSYGWQNITDHLLRITLRIKDV